MSARFPPQATYVSRDSLRAYNNGTRKIKNEMKQFDSYAELKSKLKEMIAESIDGEVYVVRSRKGEWGEWFEYWKIINGKPMITKEGWN